MSMSGVAWLERGYCMNCGLPVPGGGHEDACLGSGLSPHPPYVCRSCAEPIRRVRPDDGYDPGEFEWTHAGGVTCDLPCTIAESLWPEPLGAEPFTD